MLGVGAEYRAIGLLRMSRVHELPAMMSRCTTNGRDRDIHLRRAGTIIVGKLQNQLGFSLEARYVRASTALLY